MERLIRLLALLVLASPLVTAGMTGRESTGPGVDPAGVALSLPVVSHQPSGPVNAAARGLYRGHTAAYWARIVRVRSAQLRHARRLLFARPSVAEAINLAGATYGQTAALWRKARCESHLNPRAQNRSEASGLFQFLPSTWRSTPYGGFSIWSAYANALAAGWMHAHGRGGEWVCR